MPKHDTVMYTVSLQVSCLDEPFRLLEQMLQSNIVY